MRILLVTAHPEGESFNHSLSEAFLKGARAGGHSVMLLDLYAEGFDPVMGAAELKGELGKDTLKYQEMIRHSDCLAFIYPVWWFRAPAILEGWFDKVFSVRFAFKYKKLFGNFGIPVGLLPVKKAVVIETYGSPGWATKYLYANLCWRRLKRGLLKFCGVKKLWHFPCFSVPYATPKQRSRWLASLERLAARLQ